MANSLRIFQLIDNQRIELGTLVDRDVSVGREDGAVDLVLQSTAISRQHALFRPFRSSWFFCDSGSTNGSWLNGQRVQAGTWMLLRAGDVVQLADVLLELGQVPGSPMQSQNLRSLVVLSRGSLFDEYPVPEYGRALVIGGSKADLRLDVDVHELPSVVFESRGDSMTAFTIAKETKAYYNGREITHPVMLKDRDVVEVEHFTVIYNDLSSVAAHSGISAAQGGGAFLPSRITGGEEHGSFGDQKGTESSAQHGESAIGALSSRGPSGAALARDGGLTASGAEPLNFRPSVSRSFPWDAGEAESSSAGHEIGVSARRSVENLPFGRLQSEHKRALAGMGNADRQEINQTIAIEPHEMAQRVAGYDASPGRRFSSDFENASDPYSIEDKIWLSVGIILLLTLVGLVLWWVLST